MIAFVLFAVPLVWAATMALVFICGGDFYYLFPPAGWSRWMRRKIGPGGASSRTSAWHLFMPVVLLSYDGFAGLSRYMRASMLEVLRQDYVQVARSKGLDEGVVVFKHVLRNSLIPQVTLLASILPGMIGGSVIIETIFSIPGLGPAWLRVRFIPRLSVVLALLAVTVDFNLDRHLDFGSAIGCCRSANRLRPPGAISNFNGHGIDEFDNPGHGERRPPRLAGYGPMCGSASNAIRSRSPGFFVVCVFVLMALFADFIANDKPYYTEYKSKSYFPIFRSYLVGMKLGQWPAELLNVEFKKLEGAKSFFPPIPYRPSNINLLEPLEPPSGRHWFGTDKLGRDVMAGMVHGSRVSLSIGFVAVGIAVMIGVVLGAIAGYFGSWTDLVISRLFEVMLSIPTFFLLITIAALVAAKHFSHDVHHRRDQLGRHRAVYPK